MPDDDHIQERLSPERADSLLREAFDTEYTLRAASRPVPAEFRPQWRIPVLLMILAKCRGRKASWQQLHVMNWAVRSENTRHAFAALLAGELRPDRVLVRYEPTLTRVVDLATGLGYAEWENGRLLALTEKGRAAAEVVASTEALAAERAFLDLIPNAITQRRIDEALTER